MSEKIGVSVEHGAEIMDISPNHLRKLIRDGVIPCVRMGRRIIIPMEALKDYLKKK